MLVVWRTFQFDNVAFRVSDVDGWALPLCAIARRNRTNLDPESLQMMADSRLVERLHLETEVIQVACVLSRRGAASPAKFAIYRYQIDESCTGAELDQTDFFLAAFHGTAENFAIEAQHCVEINDAQNEVVDLANMNHLAGAFGHEPT